MKKTRIFAELAAMARGLAVFGCKSETETMKIALSVPEAKSNTFVTVTVNITTPAKKIVDVVYKKDGGVNAAALLADADAKKAEQNSVDNKKWTFEITAADETANGTYTVAALDSGGREEIAQITIDNFDFTPPAKVKGVTATYSSELKVIILNWTNPADSDFDHVEIVYTTNDGTDSEESEAIAESSANKTFSDIDGNKSYYTYYIASVDKLGNKSNKVKYKVSVNKTVSNVPEGFVEIPSASIAGTESWTPSSNVFVSGRKLEIASFYMSDHPVTRGEYKDVMGSDPSTDRANDKDGNELTGDDNVKNNPVNYISWYDALVYCNTRSIDEGLDPCYKISGSTDPNNWGSVPTSNNGTWNAATCDFTADGYRLPTEAEWEWAARGGKESTYTYAGSDDIDEVAWYRSNTNDSGTREVRTKKANAYGLYDMSGNVWEWCWDWYGSISSGTAGAGPASGSFLCLRGGSWYDGDILAQVAHRSADGPDYRYDEYYPYYRSGPYGFRLVRNAN